MAQQRVGRDKGVRDCFQPVKLGFVRRVYPVRMNVRSGSDQTISGVTIGLGMRGVRFSA